MYSTRLTDTVTVVSRDVTLSKGRKAREHTLVGTPIPLRVWEDRVSGRCMVYSGANHVATEHTLHAAYATALRLAEKFEA